ncbi:hypothetical protein [Verrucomicrobium spinosum]|uniref:hypothetical protein n=1 Tax=Verrucomicrobium spinosum TaxID=2736 RepID=UPI0012E0F072|nr:hypothetical protein [Verrucomicrobium spinosum]
MIPRRLIAAAAVAIPLLPALLAADPVAESRPSVGVPSATEVAPAVQAPAGTDFVRFVEDDAGARLQTGIASYRNKEGLVVDLIGAIHVADQAYFEKLNAAFKGYEVVLYEMVGGPISQRERRELAAEKARQKPQDLAKKPGDAKPASPAAPAPPAEKKVPAPKGGARELGLEQKVADLEAYMKGTTGATPAEEAFEAEEDAAAGKLSWLHGLHATLQNTLALKGQLDVIDYHAANFVHADMSLAEFAVMQNQRNEGFVALWLKAVQVQMNQPQSSASQPGLLKILEILCRKDSATELKRLFGRTFDSVEAVMTGMESGDGTVIVSERNKVALRVLQQQIKAGKKHLAIFYGAAPARYGEAPAGDGIYAAEKRVGDGMGSAAAAAPGGGDRHKAQRRATESLICLVPKGGKVTAAAPIPTLT